MFLSCALWLAAASLVTAELRTVCEYSTADLTCGSGQVIQIDSAYYGRSDRTTCSEGLASKSLQNVNCAASGATNRVATMCNGKSSCSVKASNSVFGDPCYDTVKYLQFSYTCKGGASELTTACELSTAVLTCGSGQVISIDSARYGRSDRTTCSKGRPSKQLQNVHCATSTATQITAMTCDGQSSCSIKASNSVFGDPCVGTFKYLQVSYSCVCEDDRVARMVACEGQTASLNCHSGKVIHVHRADYGRHDRTICIRGRPSRQLRNVHCASSTANQRVAQMCNGKPTCSVRATNSVFGDDPCRSTYKYLKLRFSCVCKCCRGPVI